MPNYFNVLRGKFFINQGTETKTKVTVVVIHMIPDDFTRNAPDSFPQNDFHFSANNFLNIFLYVSHYLEIKFSSSIAFARGLSFSVSENENVYSPLTLSGNLFVSGGKLQLFEGYLSEFYGRLMR